MSPIRGNGDVSSYHRRTDGQRFTFQRLNIKTKRFPRLIRECKKPLSIRKVTNPLIFETGRSKIAGLTGSHRERP